MSEWTVKVIEQRVYNTRVVLAEGGKSYDAIAEASRRVREGEIEPTEVSNCDIHAHREKG